MQHFYVLAAGTGVLTMEVGINRINRFTYPGGDYIECFRKEVGTDDVGQAISIPLQRWHKMKLNQDAIITQLKELFAGNPVECRFHLGGLLFFQISSKYKNVQFRQYQIPQRSTRMFPTKFGVSMSLSEYFYFVHLDEQFVSLIPAMESITPCYEDPNHSELCMECFPVKRDNCGVPGWAEFEKDFITSGNNAAKGPAYRKVPGISKNM